MRDIELKNVKFTVMIYYYKTFVVFVLPLRICEQNLCIFLLGICDDFVNRIFGAN